MKSVLEVAPSAKGTGFRVQEVVISDKGSRVLQLGL